MQSPDVRSTRVVRRALLGREALAPGSPQCRRPPPSPVPSPPSAERLAAEAEAVEAAEAARAAEELGRCRAMAAARLADEGFPAVRAERVAGVISAAAARPRGWRNIWVDNRSFPSMTAITAHLRDLLLAGAAPVPERPSPSMASPGAEIPEDESLAVASFAERGVGRLSGWQMVRVRWEGRGEELDQWISASELRHAMGDAMFDRLFAAAPPSAAPRPADPARLQ